MMHDPEQRLLGLQSQPVFPSGRRSAPYHTGQANLHVCNIHPSTPNTEIAEMFSAYGEVNKVFILRHANQQTGMRSAIVQMLREEGRVARRALDGAVLRGNRLRVRISPHMKIPDDEDDDEVAVDPSVFTGSSPHVVQPVRQVASRGYGGIPPARAPQTNLRTKPASEVAGPAERLPAHTQQTSSSTPLRVDAPPFYPAASQSAVSPVDSIIELLRNNPTVFAALRSVLGNEQVQDQAPLTVWLLSQVGV